MARQAGGTVKVLHEPISELVVHDVVKSNIDDIIRRTVTPAGAMPLYWCEGMLLSFVSLPPTRDVIKDYMAGRLHWAEVRYAVMETYKETLELHEEQFIKTRVIDTSDNSVHRGFVGWVRSAMR